MESQYRRKEDESPKLLILLNERVSVIQETLTKLVDKQSDNPCKTHELRIRDLEKIMYGIVSAVFLLMLKAVFSFLSRC